MKGRALVRSEIYLRTVGLRGMAAAAAGVLTRKPRLLRMTWPGVRHPFWVRVPSSDVPTLDQIQVRREYEFEVDRAPEVIIDAGANVGLASIYFASRYPGARILAIEPEAGNLELLERNVAAYPNVTVVRAALWHENAPLDLVDPGLGQWAFMTQGRGEAEHYGPHVHEVQGITLDTLCRDHGLERIDILKMDIEGAEREVFADPSAWIGKVDTLIVELHDRMKPGCSRSFYDGSRGFGREWRQGENVYLARERSCLRRRA